MAEYTYKDVIIDPEDPRVEIGAVYYFALGAQTCIYRANNDSRGTRLQAIDGSGEYRPFISDDEKDYPFIIRKKEVSYAERQKKWIKENDLKVGDLVRVTREAEDYEDGWKVIWAIAMSNLVGSVLKVKKIDEECGIVLSTENKDWFFPYFVLEKVEQKYVPFDFSDLACREFLLGKAVKHKEGQVGPALIIGFSQFEGGMWMANAGGVEAVNTVALLHDWVFLDGTPCGKLVKEEE